jgi:Gpi18-like mannosyltransferase
MLSFLIKKAREVELQIGNKIVPIKKTAKIVFLTFLTLFNLLWWIENIFNFTSRAKNHKVLLVSMYTLVSIFWYVYLLFFSNSKRSSITLLEYIWLICNAIVIRILLATLIEGHPTDISCFRTWMNEGASDLFNIYEKEFFIDYLPIYISILALMKKIAVLLGININDILLVKLPAIFADVIIAIFIGIIVKIRGKDINRKEALFLLFNPALILLSCWWGQSDSFVLMLILFLLVSIIKRKYIISGILASLMVFTKLQVIFYMPYLVAYWFYLGFVQKRMVPFMKQIISFLVSSIVLYYLFMPYNDYFWLFKFVKKLVEEYPYYTVNAFNIFFAANKNWFKTPSLITVVNMTLLFLTYILFVVMLKRFNSKIVPEKFFVLGGAITGLVSFSLMTGMHERYLIYGWIFIVIVHAIENSDSITWWSFSILFSYILFLNIAVVFAHSLENSFFVPYNFSNSLASLIGLVSTVTVVYKCMSKQEELCHKTS